MLTHGYTGPEQSLECLHCWQMSRDEQIRARLITGTVMTAAAYTRDRNRNRASDNDSTTTRNTGRSSDAQGRPWSSISLIPLIAGAGISQLRQYYSVPRGPSTDDFVTKTGAQTRGLLQTRTGIWPHQRDGSSRSSFDGASRALHDVSSTDRLHALGRSYDSPARGRVTHGQYRSTCRSLY